MRRRIRNADFQSAVSQVYNLQRYLNTREAAILSAAACFGRLKICVTAGYKPALRNERADIHRAIGVLVGWEAAFANSSLSSQPPPSALMSWTEAERR